MVKITRRSFVATMSAATLLPAVPCNRRLSASGYVFFDPADARFIEAACDRLIPADDSGPGARAAAVPQYIDQQLAGPWGAGERLYRNGAWQAGSSPFGYEATVTTPALFFRTALRAIHIGFSRRAITFNALAVHDQDAYLKSLESGTAHVGESSRTFFDLLLRMTIEGFFGDPRYGSTRDRVTWPMLGFPGAYAYR